MGQQNRRASARLLSFLCLLLLQNIRADVGMHIGTDFFLNSKGENLNSKGNFFISKGNDFENK